MGYAVAELGEDTFGELSWPDDTIPRPSRSPKRLTKKVASSRPLSSTFSSMFSSFRSLSSIESHDRDLEICDRLFWRDLYHSKWMDKLFQKTRRLSHKMSKLRAFKKDISKNSLLDRVCMGYMNDLDHKRYRVLFQGKPTC